jgi:enoyl-CoA hydratase/carnithine racemase
MHRHDLSAADLLGLLASPLRAEELADVDGTVLVVDGEVEPGVVAPARLVARVAAVPVVIVRTATTVVPAADPLGPLVDVVVPPDGPELDAIVATVGATPRAATALAMLLRGAGAGGLGAGLAAESAVYSTLQGGPEFAAWRASRPVRARPVVDGPTVLAERHGARLDIVLNRPEVRNAVSARLRDELSEALAVAAVDPTVEEVHLRGNGPAFSAGGDLDEFGSLPDPATAHLVRLTRNVGRLIAGMAGRVTAHLHGACIGSGIELPAFAGRVVARPDTVIALPEVRLGLIPGAGGTVSLPARIGRHRTAELALTGRSIDATTACAWGLVDSVGESPVGAPGP